MARIAHAERASAQTIGLPLTAKTLRRWAAPETIMAVTNLFDEERLLLHAVKQARQSGAKILLVHMIRADLLAAGFYRSSRGVEQAYSISIAQSELDRMARQLRWVGIRCHPIVLKDSPEEEIRLLAHSHGVDRVLVAMQGGRDEKAFGERAIAEEILPSLGVPVCVIGRCVSPNSQKEKPAGRITLALSLRSASDVPLEFACRLAQEHGARLTVMHVFGYKNRDSNIIDRTPMEIASRLSDDILREAQIFCPLEITVREGDAANEILKYDALTYQDFIVLGSPGAPRTASSGSASIVHRIVSEARCPVIILGQHAAASTHAFQRAATMPRPPRGIFL